MTKRDECRGRREFFKRPKAVAGSGPCRPLLKRAPRRLLIMLLLFPVAAGTAYGQDPHFKAVFENAHARVLELFAVPDGRAVVHVRQPGLVISFSRSRFEVTVDGKAPQIVDYYPGQLVWTEKAEAASWRLLAGEANLFFVEVKSALEGASPAAVSMRENHSTIIDGEQHRLVLENEHVRVIDGMADKHDRSPLHSHPPSVIVSLSKARFRVTINNKTRIFDFEPGMVRWSNHFEHTWEILSGHARVIMIELKSADGDPAFYQR